MRVCGHVIYGIVDTSLFYSSTPFGTPEVQQPGSQRGGDQHSRKFSFALFRFYDTREEIRCVAAVGSVASVSLPNKVKVMDENIILLTRVFF